VNPYINKHPAATSRGRRPRVGPIGLNALAVSLALALGWPSGAAYAQDAASARIDIPAQSLNQALLQLGQQSDIQIYYLPEVVAGLDAPAVAGELTAQQALARLLEGTGIEARWSGKTVWLSRPAPGTAVRLAPVTVTGSSPGALPGVYAGGQIAAGGRVGMLGNRDAMDTPFNVTSYTAELAANQQAVTVADVLLNDPSVRVLGSGLTSSAGQGDTFMVRGFRAYSEDVAFDGIYGIAPVTLFPAEVAERIELLKGPNALLNGMGPMGGVGGAINVVPKRAGDVPLARVTVNYASDSQWGGQVDLGRRFGENGRWGIRLNGVYRDGDTPIDSQSVEFGVATIGIDFRGARTRITLDAGYQDLDTTAPTGAAGVYVYDDLPIPRPPRASHRIAQDWEYSKVKSEYFLLKAEYDLSDDWTVYGAFGTSSNDYRWLSTDKEVYNAAGDATAWVYYYPGFNDRMSASTGLRGSFHTGPVRHDVNLNGSLMRKRNGHSFGYEYGYGYGYTSFDTNIYHPGDVPKPGWVEFPSDVPVSAETLLPTVALSDTLSFAGDRVSLTLGGRYQRVKVSSFDTATGARTVTYDKSAFTPALALLVKPTDSLSVYANYIEGLSQGATAPPGTSNAGQVFPPARTKQVEAGVKYDFGQFMGTVSVFQIVQPNGLRVRDEATGLFSFENDGRQRNRGVELNVAGQLGDFRLLGGVAYSSAKATRTQDGAYDGKTVIAVPRWQLNLGAEWDTPVPGLTIGGRMISTSPQYQNPQNTRRIPGWTRWDASARYATKAFGRNLVLRANVENLFGRDYWMTANEGWLNQGSPRTIRLSASMDF